MSDSAKGPLSGYLFQFEKALLLLSELNKSSDYITIEDVDDIATHQANGTVILTTQAKHSISNSGTTFENTSYALWRTLQIWIEKLEKKKLNQNTSFICTTNKPIVKNSLLVIIKNKPIAEVYKAINKILNALKAKYVRLIQEKKKTSINQIIQLIEYVLSKKEYFEIIKKKIEIHENENIKIEFLNKIYQYSETTTDIQRESIWDEFYGWISAGCLALWRNSNVAQFSKQQFDNKLKLITSNHAIVNAIFRAKEKLGFQLSDNDLQRKRTELFVKQIEDIPRRQEAKEKIIQDAIIDFHYYDIELMHIIKKGDYTQEDFNKFTETCFERWLSLFNRVIIREFSDYTENEKNDLAVRIFDAIMGDIEIKFNESFSFTTSNKYIQNGSFLRLSNMPRIGWHPEWKTKYENNNESE